jgi:ACS family tartrate transporter-like MFS transporter
MGAGFFGCALLRQPILAVLSLALVPIGHCAAYGPFWSTPTRFLTGAPAAAGIALVVTIANVGGFLGPMVIGTMKDRFGTDVPAFILLAACAIVAALLALRLRRVSGAEVLNRDRRVGQPSLIEGYRFGVSNRAKKSSKSES